jgi:hypothetical protein
LGRNQSLRRQRGCHVDFTSGQGDDVDIAPAEARTAPQHEPVRSPLRDRPDDSLRANLIHAASRS